MSIKTIRIIALFVLVIAAVVGLNRWRAGRVVQSNPANPLGAAFANLNYEALNALIVSRGERKAVVERGSDHVWKVEGNKADASRVKDAVQALKDTEFTGPVSRAAANFDKLGVGSSGMVVEVGPSKFVVGNSGPTYQSTYLRLDESQDTYLAAKNLSVYFSADTDFWQKWNRETAQVKARLQRS